MRIAVLAAALAGLGGGGCQHPGEADSLSVRQRVARGENAAALQASTTQPDAQGEVPRPAGRPVAWVNDVPIERRVLARMLWESRGLGLLQQLVLQEVTRQEAERLGVEINPAEVDREYDLTLQAARFNGDDPEHLTPVRREQLIEEWTRGRGVTRQELAIAMERQAILRKIVRGRIEISEEMLRPEYDRVHGEKVEVRHMQLSALRVWEQVKRRMEQGEAFADLVADYSQNRLSRQKRGLLPPFTAADPLVPAAFAEVAFALELGQMSNPIEVEGSYHVLKLERRIPAEEVAFEEVKDKLRENLFARLVAKGMERTGERLLQACRLRIEDPTISEQYRSRRAAGDLVGPPLAND